MLGGMETATMTELDGTPILEYSVGPHGDHRRLLTIAAFVICLDLAFQLAFLAPNWDSFAQVGFIPNMLLGVLSGPLAVLVPVAFVLRSPDAWQARRLILLGMLLSVANMLGHAATSSLIGLNIWQMESGRGSIPLELFSAGRNLDELAQLLGIVGTLLIAVGLSRIGGRRASRRNRSLIAIVLLVGGLLALGSLRPFFPTRGVEYAQWWWVMPALLGASELAWLCQAWVILERWRAGEEPRRPWRLAAAATSISLVAGGVAGAVVMGAAALGTPFYFLVTLLSIAGSALFLAAVADGLGSSRSVRAQLQAPVRG
jgi:hypothetical protein